jgi:oxygen-independent coproporphyrinogen-3 oxidase
LAGIYIHIPFCKQACSYCNFHFATSLRRKNELLAALLDEIKLRNDYLERESLETIYFGGGTPSILDSNDINLLIEKIFSSFRINEKPEITIETNPDDTSEEKLQAWKAAGINRLSIGIQSFFDEDLAWMNRAHLAEESERALLSAIKHFANITIDLIYGTPLLTRKKLEENIDKIIAFNVPHISCYALTVESKTPLAKMIRDGKSLDIDPDKQSEQFLLLMDRMETAGYEHYEISNFAKPGYRSRHNSSYWSERKKYLGIGPSAHSFDGKGRQWNVANNNVYIDSIKQGIVPSEKETLTPVQHLNEYIMTSLRTAEGLDLKHVAEAASRELLAVSQKFIERGLMISERDHLKLTREGKLLADGIAADLFLVEAQTG